LGGSLILAIMESAGQSQTFKRSCDATSIVIGFSAPGTDALAMTRELGAAGEWVCCFSMTLLFLLLRGECSADGQFTDVVRVEGDPVMLGRP
jgi:hypothetical protein